jgi:hypothetical protein
MRTNALLARSAHETLAQAMAATARTTDKAAHDEMVLLSFEVMARWPMTSAHAMGTLRQNADRRFGELVGERLRMAGQSDDAAAMIGAGIAAIIVQIYSEAFKSDQMDKFADRLERGLHRFCEVVGTCCRPPRKPQFGASSPTNQPREPFSHNIQA